MNDDKDKTTPPGDDPNAEERPRSVSSPSPGNGDGSLSESIGAYLLDALPDDERTAFEQYLDSNADARAEAQELAPVVALLPKLLDLEIETDGIIAPPSADLRGRIVAEAEQLLIDELPGSAAAAAANPAASSASPKARTIRTAPETTDQLAPRRAQGRIRSGVDSTSASGSGSSAPISILSRFPRQWAAAAVLAVIAVGSIIWALALESRIANKDRELNAQASEIAELRQNANATSYSLLANEGAEGAGGTLLFSLKDQIGVLYVHSLPELSPDEVYQLWYLDDASDAPTPGGTFTVDANGNGVIAVNPDTPLYDGVALTTEPEGGSKAPTSSILLQGRLGGAAG